MYGKHVKREGTNLGGQPGIALERTDYDSLLIDCKYDKRWGRWMEGGKRGAHYIGAKHNMKRKPYSRGTK